MALLAWALLMAGVAEQVRAWSEFATTEAKGEAPLAGQEIQEPFFEFILDMVSADSLGVWTGNQLQEHARARNRASHFPLAEIISVSRARPDSLVAGRYPGVAVVAVWRIVLRGPQDRAMPYSILGYHPGSLRIAGQLVLVELALGDADLTLSAENPPVHQTVTGIRVLALEQGYVLLDADGWLDALLGAGLDDAWTLGFVIGRENGRLLGLGVSVGREGRQIYGEFDFARDKVLAHGRPLASALSRLSRSWLRVDGGNLPVPWQEP